MTNINSKPNEINQTCRLNLPEYYVNYISIVVSQHDEDKTDQDEDKLQHKPLKRSKTDLKEATMTNW